MMTSLTTQTSAGPALEQLERLDAQVDRVFLARQHPISGLMPASTAHTVHGNYSDAWVRDGVYTVQAIWAMAIAWRRKGGRPQRVYELEQSVLSLMRGLLRSMMGQAHKVERFKASQDPLDALHAKYDTASGQPVVADNAWGHLQLDATALFVLQLAQLTRSGLVVVANQPQAAFLQNLIFYLSRAYRVADYGIWERGDKGNNGAPERNASSIGLVKAALEASAGLDPFGPHGDGRHILWVPPDAVLRLRRALEALLPRESASKEVDSGCLAVIGYPSGVLRAMSCAPAPKPPSTGSWGAAMATAASAAMAIRPWWRTAHACTTSPRSWLALKASNANGPCFWPLSWSAPAWRSVGSRPQTWISSCSSLRFSAARTRCCLSSIGCRRRRWRLSAKRPAASRVNPTTTCPCSGVRACGCWVSC